MHYLALIVGTLLTLVTGYSVAAASRLASKLERLLATLVVASAQIVATLLFAGLVVRSLATVTVLVVNLMVTAGVVLITARSAQLRECLRADWADLRGVRLPSPRAVPLRSAWAWVLAALVAIETAYLALVIYVLPPASFDALTYHLPAVASWIRGDRILITPLNTFSNVYPMNGDLTFLWIGSLSRSDLLIDGAQLGFAILGAIAVGAIARSIDVSKAGAFVAGSLYLLTPFVIAQATVNYVDVALPSLFLAGYAFLLRYLATDRRASTADGDADARAGGNSAYLWLAGIAVGLAAGSKSTGAMYGAVAGLLLLANLLWWKRRHSLSWGGLFARLLMFALPIVLLGSFWYIRTWVEYGNPTYPFSVEVAGVTLFDGRSPYEENKPPPEIGKYVAPLRPLVSWARVPLGYTYEQRLDGFGATWLFFELPALVIFAVYFAMRRRWLLLNFVVPFALIFLVTPSNWWARFTVLIVAPGAIALVFLIERIRRRTIALVIQAAVIVSVVAGCALSSKRYTVLSHQFTANDIASAAPDSRSERTLGRMILPEYAWTDFVPEDSTIGFAAPDLENYFVYALFGSDFRNDVVNLDPESLTADSIVDTLQREGIDYFVTRSGSARDDAAQGNPETLELVSDIGHVRVYRVTT